MSNNVDEIIEQVRGGDTEAYGLIVAEFQNELWRIVAFGLQDQSASEDLVQQTFVKAFMSLDNYQTGRDFGAWLRTIARNLLRNELRRRGREDKNLSRYSRWPYSSVHNAMGKCGCSRRLKTQLSLPKY